MEKENEIQTANEVKVCSSALLNRFTDKGILLNIVIKTMDATMLICSMFVCQLFVFRKRWRSRFTPTVKLTRSRSAA